MYFGYCIYMVFYLATPPQNALDETEMDGNPSTSGFNQIVDLPPVTLHSSVVKLTNKPFSPITQDALERAKEKLSPPKSGKVSFSYIDDKKCI